MRLVCAGAWYKSVSPCGLLRPRLGILPDTGSYASYPQCRGRCRAIHEECHRETAHDSPMQDTPIVLTQSISLSAWILSKSYRGENKPYVFGRMGPDPPQCSPGYYNIITTRPIHLMIIVEGQNYERVTAYQCMRVEEGTPFSQKCAHPRDLLFLDTVQFNFRHSERAINLPTKTMFASEILLCQVFDEQQRSKRQLPLPVFLAYWTRRLKKKRK